MNFHRGKKSELEKSETNLVYSMFSAKILRFSQIKHKVEN